MFRENINERVGTASSTLRIIHKPWEKNTGILALTFYKHLTLTKQNQFARVRT